MFSGIIETTTTIKKVEKNDKQKNVCVRVSFTRPSVWKKAGVLKIGQSIAVDGICSTVVAYTPTTFAVEYMPETISKTTAADFVVGRHVNLERSLTLHTLLDGHIVQGHVDGVGTVQKIEDLGGTWRINITYPSVLSAYVAAVGAITVNGVSLTVASVSKTACVVCLIPHTLAHTNLGGLRVGDTVNIEVDCLARYVVAALSKNDTLRAYAKKKR
jgi:riboflavin synthase